jgi:CIC family chloride channel protein
VSPTTNAWRIPPTLATPGARAFWRATILTGVGAGLAAVGLTRLLELVQAFAWTGRTGSPGATLLDAARAAPAARHIVILLAAGALTSFGQFVLRHLASGNGIETTEAIWFRAGRLPALRTLGSAVLSVLVVALGASLGREGAAKQAGAVFANVASAREGLSDEQRRLLVACGTGAGMAAAYGVPLGGALFALEVMRGALALRMVLPAMVTSLLAATVALVGLPDAPTYVIPSYSSSACVMVWAVVMGPLLGLVSVGYVRAVAWADRHKPKGTYRYIAPVVVLGALGALSVPFPELLGNGRDVTQLAFVGQVGPWLLLALVFLKPAATIACLGSGAPGGLFTPSLTLGAVLGGFLGWAWACIWPGAPVGLFALLGAAAILAATTQGPISSVVLMMELTGRDRSFIAPMLLAVAAATVIARTIEMRSIYEARLSDDQVAERKMAREPMAGAGERPSPTGAGHA